MTGPERTLLVAQLTALEVAAARGDEQAALKLPSLRIKLGMCAIPSCSETLDGENFVCLKCKIEALDTVLQRARAEGKADAGAEGVLDGLRRQRLEKLTRRGYWREGS